MRTPDGLHELAHCQSGIVSRGQLRTLGVSAAAVKRRIDAGLWRQYLAAIDVGPVGISTSDALLMSDPRSVDHLEELAIRDAWAMHLSCKVPVLISGTAALHLHGWHLAAHVLAVRARVHTRIPQVQLVRRSNASITRGQLPQLVSPDEALIDTLRYTDRTEAFGILDEALQRRYISVEAFVQAAHRESGRGRPESPRLGELVRRIITGTQSDGERRLLPVLRRTGVRDWECNYPVRDREGVIIARVDFALPHLLLAIEFDGRAFHSDHDSFERDRKRQNALVVEGWTVLRFTWDHLTEQPDHVMATVRAAIRDAETRFGGKNVRKTG